MVSVERQRLQKSLRSALARKRDIERDIAGIQHELNAMQAFFSAKHGNSAAGHGSERPRRGQKRRQILDLIKSVPECLTRGEIIQRLNATENAAKQSISSALSNLFNENALKREGRRYQAA